MLYDNTCKLQLIDESRRTTKSREGKPVASEGFLVSRVEPADGGSHLMRVRASRRSMYSSENAKRQDSVKSLSRSVELNGPVLGKAARATCEGLPEKVNCVLRARDVLGLEPRCGKRWRPTYRTPFGHELSDSFPIGLSNGQIEDRLPKGR